MSHPSKERAEVSFSTNNALAIAILVIFVYLPLGSAQGRILSGQSSLPACRIEPIEFAGWKAQQLSNQWVKVTIVPKLGGRVMQVSFAGHPFLFVNPAYRGQYFPPNESADSRRWINYGGDKIWPMPEGSQDDKHWPGPISDVLDDGEYAFHILSQEARCAVRLDGPADSRTGLSYSREISIDARSPEISFHTIMKNTASHPIDWSMQSVTQYDTSDARSPQNFHRNFWAYTPANTQSAYLDGFHVRSGLSDDPSFSIRDGLFSLHWLYLQSEVWIDSPGDWLAVADQDSGFAMVERFEVQKDGNYPGKATVIFYKNGPAVEMDSKGYPAMRTSAEDAPYYMEAEINSPVVRLGPGETYAMDTRWYPARIGESLKSVASAGVISNPLTIEAKSGELTLTGSFGVFSPGTIVARFLNEAGAEIGTHSLGIADPAELFNLRAEIAPPPSVNRISVHLIDESGTDRGELSAAIVKHRPGGH
jgi:hypothetical protein